MNSFEAFQNFIKYFYNQKTGETTWDEPEDVEIIPACKFFKDSYAQELNEILSINDQRIDSERISCVVKSNEANICVINSVESLDIGEIRDLLNFMIEKISVQFEASDIGEVSPSVVESTIKDNYLDSKDLPKIQEEDYEEEEEEDDDTLTNDDTIEGKEKVEMNSSNPFDDNFVDPSSSNPFDDNAVVISVSHPPATHTGGKTQKLKAKSFIIRSSSPMITICAPPMKSSLPSTVAKINSNFSSEGQSSNNVNNSNNSNSNPQAVSYPKKLFSSRASTCLPRPSQFLVSSINDCPQRNFENLSINTKRLLRMGVTYKVATNALLQHQDDLLAACNMIHDNVVDAVNKDPYHSQLNFWVPRISLRIKGWLPNLQSEQSNSTVLSHHQTSSSSSNNSNSNNTTSSGSKDYFTGYVLTVSFTDTNDSLHSWRLTYRFQRFRSLCDCVCKHGSHVPVKAPFPYATAMQTLFGLDDEGRTERMNSLDRWLREVVLNPCLMTVLPINNAIFDFLQVDAHVHKEGRTS